MSSDDLKAKVKAAQEAVKGVDTDLRKSAFEVILRSLLQETGENTPTEPTAKKKTTKVKVKSKSRSGALHAAPAHGLAPLVGARVVSLRGPILRCGQPYSTTKLDRINHCSLSRTS